MHLKAVLIVPILSITICGAPLTPLEKLAQPKLTLQSSYMQDAAIDKSDAKVSSLKHSLKINNAFAGIEYSHWFFDWHKAATLPFVDNSSRPIEELHRIKLTARLPYRFNERWFSLSIFNVNSSFEERPYGTLGAGLMSFFSYRLDDDHTIEFGAFGNYHKVRTLALPVISYSYRARASDGFQFIFGFPRTYVGYRLNRDLLLHSGVIYSQAVSRLGRTSPVEASGFVELKEYHANIGMQYDVDEQWSLTADLLFSLKRDFVIYSTGGDRLHTHTIKSVPGGLLKLRYAF